jgi:hypothetical membrane protein
MRRSLQAVSSPRLLLLGPPAAPRGFTPSLAFILLASFGKVGVGLVPENTELGLHPLAALNIPLTSIALLLLGRSVRRSPLGTGAVLAGVIGLLALVLSAAAGFTGVMGFYLGLGRDGEIVGLPPSLIWLLVLGAAAPDRE